MGKKQKFTNPNQPFQDELYIHKGLEAGESWQAGEPEKPGSGVGAGALDPRSGRPEARPQVTLGAEEPSGIFLPLLTLSRLFSECVYAHNMHESHGTCAEVRGQPVGLLLPCGSQGLNSGRQAWEKPLLSA